MSEIPVKRYEVKDQNGDVLASYDNWSLAITHFSSWLSKDNPENAGSGIWDNEDEEWSTQWFPREDRYGIQDDDPCPCGISHTRSEHNYDPDKDED